MRGCFRHCSSTSVRVGAYNWIFHSISPIPTVELTWNSPSEFPGFLAPSKTASQDGHWHFTRSWSLCFQFLCAVDGCGSNLDAGQAALVPGFLNNIRVQAAIREKSCTPSVALSSSFERFKTKNPIRGGRSMPQDGSTDWKETVLKCSTDRKLIVSATRRFLAPSFGYPKKCTVCVQTNMTISNVEIIRSPLNRW